MISLGDIKAKWQSFGWNTVTTRDGNDIEQLIDSIYESQDLALSDKKPVAHIMNTTMGCGVDFMENNYKWHGSAPNDTQLQKALEQLEETMGDY